MASVGHIAFGMAAARVYDAGRTPRWSSMAWWSAVSLLPDVDVIGFGFGVRYGDEWGHRGATHSLTMSLAIGLAIGFLARRFKWPAARTALLATLLVASHGLLDTMTDGGLGCALFWPFDLTRYFAPWRPIPVAPIGLDYFTSYGAIIAVTELALFSPAVLFAVWPRRAAPRGPVAVFIALWLVSVWLISSTDPIRERIVSMVVRDETAHASGYSEEAFRTIAPGTSAQEVRRRLGDAYREGWFYPPRDVPFQPAMERSAAAFPHECLSVQLVDGVVSVARDSGSCVARGVAPGVSRDEVERALGAPPESCSEYTWSVRDGPHRLRMICFADARVEQVFRRWVFR
jgi:inner membrane protein